MTSIKSLTWNDRIALLNHFQPSEDDACRILQVSSDELKVVRNLEGKMFRPTRNLDYNAYATTFGRVMNSPSTLPSPSTDLTAPLSGSKPRRAPKKRGRQGQKIANAFASIPYDPTPVTTYATEKGVSLNALRQCNRFDKSPQLGKVHVKKDKETKILMIWRDQP